MQAYGDNFINERRKRNCFHVDFAKSLRAAVLQNTCEMTT